MIAGNRTITAGPRRPAKENEPRNAVPTLASLQSKVRWRDHGGESAVGPKESIKFDLGISRGEAGVSEWNADLPATTRRAEVREAEAIGRLPGVNFEESPGI